MSRILKSRADEISALRPACPRVPVTECPVRIPTKWIEDLEQNQKIPSCCRHPENHDIQAFYSSAEDEAKGAPDIYWFICKGNHELEPGVFGEAVHRRFCVGGSFSPKEGRHTHKRPFWEIR